MSARHYFSMLGRSLALSCLLLATAPFAQADIISDLASATIIERFEFDDAAGTTIDAAANSSGTGHLFDFDADSEDIVTNGMGQLDVSLKNNTSFGTNYVDNDNITVGRVFGVMELTWDFDTAVFDPAQDEELRITLINNDPRGSQVTAEVEIQRNGLTDLVIQGAASNGTAIPAVTLPMSQSANFIAVVDANLDTDMYSIHFSADNGATFTSSAPGAIDPTRIANALRMVINEDYAGDNVLIERVYLATIVPEPATGGMGLLMLLGLLKLRRR